MRSELLSVAKLGALIGFVMFGYTLGSGRSDALVAFVKEDRDRARNDLAQLRDEFDSLKLQLATTVSNNPAISSEAEKAENKTDPDNPSPQRFASEQRIIQTQNTDVFFDGSLDITLIATHYSGSPLRYKASATVLIPGSEPFTIKDADPGSAFSVGDFQVVIFSTGIFSATFKVFKIK
ncbi:hypothetical protein CIG19_05640 [Enterobacterales bacterium CwR94]|nr:hypothetical protein CIG19_05640 [Enterobacterales bacterium CwR94]